MKRAMGFDKRQKKQMQLFQKRKCRILLSKKMSLSGHNQNGQYID